MLTSYMHERKVQPRTLRSVLASICQLPIMVERLPMSNTASQVPSVTAGERQLIEKHPLMETGTPGPKTGADRVASNRGWAVLPPGGKGQLDFHRRKKREDSETDLCSGSFSAEPFFNTFQRASELSEVLLQVWQCKVSLVVKRKGERTHTHTCRAARTWLSRTRAQGGHPPETH